MLQLDRETLNDRAYKALRQNLISGRFAPGEPLVIRKLAETLGISTTPIREALQRLVAERMLEMRHNRSAAVPKLSLAAFRELVAIRLALEGLAAERAAAHMRPAALKRLRKLTDGMDNAIAAGDGAAYLALNEKFHFGVYALAGAPILVSMIEDLWGRVGPYMKFLMEIESYAPHSNAHHRAWHAALEQGDAVASRQALIADIEAAADALLPRLAKA
jgi:DNA-binding GntR family transcriptional regulator